MLTGRLYPPRWAGRRKPLMYAQPVPPFLEYTQRLKDRESRVAHLERVQHRAGTIRLLMVLAAAAFAWESLHAHALAFWWVLLPAVAFLATAIYHSRVLQARDLAQRGVTFYRNGFARIEDRWAGAGQTGDAFNDPHHVYACDLDLFGHGSLFELLSTARTRMGEHTLAKWLLSPAPMDQIAERHAAVHELRDQLDLREDLAVLGDQARVGVHPEELLGWAKGPNGMKPDWLRWLAAALVLAVVAAAVVWWVYGIAMFFLVIVLIEGLARYRLRGPLLAVLQGSEQAFRNLDLLAGVLKRIERHRFSAPRLQTLQRQLWSHRVKSSDAIARLSTIVEFIRARGNALTKPLDIPLMYSVQVGFAAERWRSAHGHAVQSWLDVIGEIEALLSLATYSYEHPDDPFPELVQGEPCFDGTELGHPLIPAARCVRNSVHLSEGRQVFLVSGSNMSGKSTLLRSVGINAVLAMAGAPVRAQHLRMTPLQVGASIRVSDSLQEGSSRFYAEITRLRKVYDLASGDPTLLFLLDELLQGTNSKDRRIGSEGIVRALLARRAIGLVSTHDLALADIGSTLDGHLCNVHFQEEFLDGKMYFDYKLQEGLVTKTNGLALMRSIGLEV
jgi:MutS domain V